MPNFAIAFGDDEDTPMAFDFGSVFAKDNTNWADTLAEMSAPPSTQEGWDIVTRPIRVVAAPQRPARWCNLGNACMRGDCRYRHERCAHYDAWIARGRRGHTCRSMDRDPRSVLPPSEGGCMYDHRDPRDLTVTPEVLPVVTEQQLIDSFYTSGLECMSHGSYGFARMRQEDFSRLIRSLKAAKVEYEVFGDYINIKCVEEGEEVDMSTLPVSTKDELLESFGPLGLMLTDDVVAFGFFCDISAMNAKNQTLLRRSLRARNVDALLCENMLYVA